jgi:hypothetical protein
MSPGVPYPSSTGILDCAGARTPTSEEVARLRDEVASILDQSSDPEALLDELLRAANLMRNAKILDDERKTLDRRRNIENKINGRERLSTINQLALNHMSAVDGRPENELLSELSAKLRNRRGRPPKDHLVHMAMVVRMAFDQYMSQPPSGVPSGGFVALLEAVATVADGRVRTGLHSLAEEVLRIEITSLEPGLTSYDLPRFA